MTSSIPGGVYGALAVLGMSAALAGAQEPRQSLDDAWWTGPMLAASAATLPRGHFLVEPYVYDVIVAGRYDHNGVRRDAPREDGFGTLVYALYGLTDRLTVGVIPTAGYNTVPGGVSSSSAGMGDLSAQGQYRLTQFHEGGWFPTISVVLQETFPTGKHDRLSERPGDGLGSGAYTTTLALYSQTYLWLPNGRILRTRLDLSQSFSTSVDVQGVSVYGTGEGFQGRAKPGSSFLADLSFEYSLSRSFVAAFDVAYRHTADTRLTGSGNRAPLELDLGSSDAIALAPAIEYSWTPNLGVLVGVRVITSGRNTARTVTPAVAINMVF